MVGYWQRPDDTALARDPEGWLHTGDPRAVLLSTEPWTVAGGLITPTLKPKRLAIEARYAKEIAALYRGH
jgi:long-subunit acyl-CoA synthetase (AMP-forming)